MRNSSVFMYIKKQIIFYFKVFAPILFSFKRHIKMMKYFFAGLQCNTCSVNHFIYCLDSYLIWFTYFLQWSNENQSDLVEAAGSLFRQALSILMPSGASTRQLPPSISAIGPKSRVIFPLGMGHASEYIRHRVALIGYVYVGPL